MIKPLYTINLFIVSNRSSQNLLTTFEVKNRSHSKGDNLVFKQSLRRSGASYWVLWGRRGLELMGAPNNRLHCDAAVVKTYLEQSSFEPLLFSPSHSYIIPRPLETSFQDSFESTYPPASHPQSHYSTSATPHS